MIPPRWTTNLAMILNVGIGGAILATALDSYTQHHKPAALGLAGIGALLALGGLTLGIGTLVRAKREADRG